MRFASELSRPGGAYGQGRRKVARPRRVGKSGTPYAIGERTNRYTTRLDSTAIFPGESQRPCVLASTVSFPVVPFAACFAYLPGGSGPVSDEGKLLCARLKATNASWLSRFAAAIWLEKVGHGWFSPALGDRVVLVPVPGSIPAKCAYWVGERLAWCLKEIGLAAEVWPVLRRRHAVRKSACAAPGERPSVLEHYDSFDIDRALRSARYFRGLSERREGRLQLTLVDDVITRGRTMIAAARRLEEAFPGADICAFAFLRTLRPDEVLRQILDPCEGEVRWVSGDARRCP